MIIGAITQIEIPSQFNSNPFSSLLLIFEFHSAVFNFHCIMFQGGHYSLVDMDSPVLNTF